ncbi:ESPR-type extended signal peptide-containing protein [Veillonella rogosae]|uniref:ESPR-type extended signal peptide-containing protein n=1 Tax=Veillonella rogosae TaxID=423477 RepID=A0AA46X769_9FIRM|nr:YadA-like family protein [Veillonella rogosae]UZG51066.1 ESPR-type extended signal peptide-containing protein [Veillonella rogosae]
MNRIYNVIWSKTKKCYVVVSEIVKSSGGKVKSLHTGKTYTHMSTVMAVAALLAGVNITSVNAAAIMIDGVNAGYATAQNGGNKWSYLYNYNNPGNMNALDGSATTGYYSGSALNGISIGHNTKIQESSDPTYYSGVAIGDYAQATGGLSFSLGNYAQSTKPSAMAIGTASLSSGFNSLAMMRQSAATGNFSTAIGTTSWASGTGSFALGYSAQSKGDQSIAIGAAEPITVAGSGNEPSAAYNGNTNTVTEGARSLAFGTKARTTAAATDSMAFGSNAKTKAANAVAMGNSSRATGTDSFAFGNTASAAGANAIAMGRTAQASKVNAIALGGQAKALEANALAIGSTAEASKAGTMAIGSAAKATSSNATAIGNGAEVTGENSMALGSGAKISSNNSIALGAGTEFNDPLVNTYAAFTNEMNPAEAGVVAVGNTSTPRRIVNVAGGQNDNDAATIKQLRYVNNNLAQTIAGPTYTGYEANGSTYKAPDFSIKNSTYHTVKEAVEAAQTNFFSAKGTSADANYDNKGATGTNATAAGVRASAAGNFGTALGADATATSDKSTALGYKAKVTEDDGVALGSNSVANTAAGVTGYDVSVADNRANRYTDLTGSVATSTLGAVSVGQSTSVGTETRQITNLAAGKKDTDAVNVAQLRNVNLKIAGNTNDNNGKNDVLLDKQTLTVKGDGTYVTTKANNQTIDVTLTNDTKDKIDNAANKDLSNITNVGKKNITALGTIVEAGHNVTIPAATVDTTTGQKTYTVNAMDTKVSLGTSGLMTLTGGTPDANGVRNYTVDVDPTKVAKTDLSNINNDGKTVIREEAQKAVKVIAGQNTTVTEGTDGTYKTYAVNVAAAGDYRLVENSATADKAYTVTGNKVDLTVQDGSTPANTKTVTIKDIASKTELDSTKTDLTNKISDTKTELTTKINDTKTELSNKIDDTKTDLINTGLKFNADNNDVKTNKLGSTVTVSGDANITTKITQTGDDSTIAVALNKDLNVKTVTATNTVKAGTTTAGSQTATDNKGGTQTGNFVTGLDNTAWNMADPVFVSGRAATEDQLKTVSDAVRAANAGSSDYRLIENDTATDKAYTVTGNKVDLKVKDDKSGTTNTVTIKDIASKTEFDKLNDRAVKYDVDGSGNVDKSKVTYEGPTYNSTNKSGGTHVTNVAYATGNDGSEAVNVDYLTDKINDSSEALINKGMKFDANVGGVKTNKLGSTVKVQGEGTEADANYSGKNIKTFIGQDSSGNTTIDVKMNKNLEVETVTATGANGKDGKIGINGKDGVTTNLSITRDGQPGVDGAAGTTTTRIVYEKPDGTTEEVATLNDGLKFKGDMGPTSNVKLNKQVDVTGGVTNAADLATGNNIGVTSAAVDANGNAKLQLQLAKDITGLKSVTATDTVKAGTATVGNQTAIDNKGGTQTGNFVTGLDNTNWNMTDPVFVPGRAATEDQLKTVSDAVKAASASASDYRLIGDPANTTDGSYKVTNNQVDLKVKDDKSGTTNTVTIKDIASKTELDKLEDRAVKYDLDGTGNVDKSKVTYEGPAYNSTNKSGGTHVTNVAYATGNDGSEAVNVDYLTDKIKDSSDALINKGLKFDANVGGVQTNKLGSTVTVKGEGTAADANYSGENIKTFIEQDTAGNTTINVKMNKDIIADSIKVNKDGRDGKDGVSITGPTGVAGQDGNNGKVGITGADGKDAVSISGKDGVGHIGLTGPAGTNGKDGSNGIDMTVKNGYDDAAKGVKGEKGVDGVDGITRIVYTDNTGEHQVATMDDGMLYGGDAGNVIKKKLNNQVNVKGGITDETKLTTDDNIGVVSDGTDTLKVRLAKDLKGLNTVTAAETVKAGTATMGNQEATKADGTKETGNYVTGLDNKTWDVDNIVTGRAATEDQLKDALANQSNAGLKFDANVGGTKTNKLGSTVIVKGEGTDADTNYSGENIKTFIDQDATTGTTTINVKLNKNLVADSIKVNKDGKDGKDGVSITGPTGVAGQEGNNGKVGITGADGEDAVSISGKDGVGHIGLTGPAGTNGKDGKNGIDISVKNGYDDAAKGVKGEKGVDGVDGITRIVYTDNTGEHQVATMDDGMLYGGDTGTVIKKKLNNQVNVKGGITDAAKLSNEDNIGVVADGTDTLMLRLAKDLKGLNSATFNNGTDGNTVVNGGGLTINDAAGNPLTSVTKDGVVITDGPSMTKDGIDASDKKITNVADGTIGAGSKDAVNGGQLHTVVEDLKTKGFGLTAEDGASVKKSLGDTVTVKGDGTNITTSVDNGAVKVALARDLNVDTVTANTVTTGDTKMDTNGVTIKDGANEATKLTKDGLQINDGGNKAVTIDKDGLTIENGPKVTKDGINAGDKKITNVEDGTIAAGSKDAVNGGQLHTAMEDIKAQGFGLKAEDGQSVKKPLGEVIDLKGDGNIKTSVDGTVIKMSLNDTITLGTDPAKQVKVDGSTGTITAGNGANQVTIDGNTGSVTAGNTVKAGDVIMGNQNSGGENGNFVTGLDNKTWNPNNPVAVTGRAATEDQLKAVNDDFNEKAKNGRVFQGDQAGNDGKVVRGLGDTMNLKGGADVNRLSDNNLAVVKNAAGDGYDIKLAKDLNLKDGSTTYTKTVPGTNTTIPYTVDTKVDGGGITITPSINGQPVPGHTVSLTENGLNNGNNTITNVAPGINGTDAVNVNQLRNAMHSVDGKIADVGAASAAMAGLKPLQYDPLEPTQVLAAVGNYKGSTAAAIGIAHYTNESTMLHMGVSLGGHDNMVNAGVSYKFGTSDAKKAIPARYKAGPISSAYVMQDEVAALKAENLRMKQRDEELSAKYEQVQRDNEEMKAQIAMLMKQAGLTK